MMEFQAIVLAGGKGNRINELTKKVPKCLLPIGNKPMVWYPVRFLEKAGFNEIIIITFNSIKNRVEDELRDYGIRSRLVVVGFDDNGDDDNDDFGTANSLYIIKDKIKHDCIIVSCDLITNINLNLLTNSYRINNASFLMMLYDISEQNFELPVPGTKEKYSPDLDYIGFDSKTNRLLFFGAQDDFDLEIELKASFLKKYPCMTLASRIQDAHLYIIKKSLIDYIIDSKKMRGHSIKGDFIPELCRKQFSKYKIQQRDEYEENSKQKKTIFDYIYNEDKLGDSVRRYTSSKKVEDLLGCYVYIQNDGICLRANNTAIYAEANRQCMGKLMPFFKRERTESVSRFEKTQIGSDSLVGDSTKIGDKSMIKKSVIGKNCNIGEKVKIINSVIFDNVTVAENSIIQGSILCSNVKILQKSEIKDTVIEHGQEISTPSKISNETIGDIDKFMESN